MITVTAFAFTGYAVTDLARARDFYEGLLGLKPGTTWESEGKGWIEYELGDGCLAITNGGGDNWQPSPTGAAIALEVADFPEAIATLRAAKVKFAVEPADFPSCSMAVVRDPDGNQVAIHHKKG